MGTRAVSGEASGGRGLWWLLGSAEGLRWYPLSGIGKPGSGTEPIHQEHMRCSRFRGSCPSDVKSAGHPEPGFPISLSGCSAALCAPGETQKSPKTGSLPGNHPRSLHLNRPANPNPGKNRPDSAKHSRQLPHSQASPKRFRFPFFPSPSPRAALAPDRSGPLKKSSSPSPLYI